MIPKMICFIFGHIREGQKNIRYVNDWTYIWDVMKLDSCPRCGAKLLLPSEK